MKKIVIFMAAKKVAALALILVLTLCGCVGGPVDTSTDPINTIDTPAANAARDEEADQHDYHADFTPEPEEEQTDRAEYIYYEGPVEIIKSDGGEVTILEPNGWEVTFNGIESNYKVGDSVSVEIYFDGRIRPVEGLAKRITAAQKHNG